MSTKPPYNLDNKQVSFRLAQYSGDEHWTIRRIVEEDYCMAPTKGRAETLIREFEEAEKRRLRGD